jgi:hypothetical protein
MNPPGDFLTGGGFILLPDAKNPINLVVHANFGVGGGCKEGGDGHGLWGHLEYIDHGSILTNGAMLKVHWTTITAYRVDSPSSSDRRARYICGTATTNDPMHPNVNFAVRAADDDQSGGIDQFDIRLTDSTGEVYFTGPVAHTLAAGNITLHNPNPSTMGSINSDLCPAFFIIVNIM